MGMMSKLIDLMLDRALARRRATAGVNEAPSLASLSGDRARQTAPTRAFTINEALNGSYIQFVRHRWNPHGPDDYESCVYIVRDGETLVDAISAVLVLMTKPEV